jgi:hypothetical protein
MIGQCAGIAYAQSLGNLLGIVKMDSAHGEPHDSCTYQKRSFLKLPVSIEVDRLLADYSRIPPLAFTTSHWDTHCSSDMLLLRGGHSGTEEDFCGDESTDSEVLANLEYLRWLLDASGPFGRATYAFIFRMKPMGVSRPHVDGSAAWKAPFRIHVPITTNEDAFLLSEGRSKHIAVGEAWTFNNQVQHAVVNGNTVRTHLIMDVLPNAKLDALLANAVWDQGMPDPARWEMSKLPESAPVFQPAQVTPLSPEEKIDLQLQPGDFAARVSQVRRIARLMSCPLKEGDIIVSVDGVTECAVARTALDFVFLCYKPGDKVPLGVIRNTERVTAVLKLSKDPGWIRLIAHAIAQAKSVLRLPRILLGKASRSHQ